MLDIDFLALVSSPENQDRVIVRSVLHRYGSAGGGQHGDGGTGKKGETTHEEISG
jgi:hypothetical protein